MNTVVILYPSLFTSYGKFSRKLSNILKNIDDFRVLFPEDGAGLIARYFSEHRPRIELCQKRDWSVDEVTHGIIFDDGEEFSKQSQLLVIHGARLRQIHIAVTRVINIKRETMYDGVKSTATYEYVGRGSYWGNPYSMYEEGEAREEVIRKYKYDFDYEKFPKKEKSQVYRLAGKRLGCYCKPEVCHADVLADYLNGWDDGR